MKYRLSENFKAMFPKHTESGICLSQVAWGKIQTLYLKLYYFIIQTGSLIKLWMLGEHANSYKIKFIIF